MNPLDHIFASQKEALRKAQLKHAPIKSPHEGYAVIQEELDELWDAIKKDDLTTACKEASHVGAMALRFVYDLYEHS